MQYEKSSHTAKILIMFEISVCFICRKKMIIFHQYVSAMKAAFWLAETLFLIYADWSKNLIYHGFRHLVFLRCCFFEIYTHCMVLNVYKNTLMEYNRNKPPPDVSISLGFWPVPSIYARAYMSGTGQNLVIYSHLGGGYSLNNFIVTPKWSVSQYAYSVSVLY